jgi:GNAT superfamily N-acetyltransferase
MMGGLLLAYPRMVHPSIDTMYIAVYDTGDGFYIVCTFLQEIIFGGLTMIRDAVPSDKSAFLSMVGEFYSSSAVMKPIDPQNFEATFAAAMDKSPFIRILIVEDDRQPIGYALISLTYSNEAGGMVVLIEEVQIDKAFRGGGHGSKLFSFLEQEYPHARRFRLEVDAKNTKAIDLYIRLGYKVFDYVQMVKEV